MEHVCTPPPLRLGAAPSNMPPAAPRTPPPPRSGLLEGLTHRCQSPVRLPRSQDPGRRRRAAAQSGEGRRAIGQRSAGVEGGGRLFAAAGAATPPTERLPGRKGETRKASAPHPAPGQARRGAGHPRPGPKAPLPRCFCKKSPRRGSRPPPASSGKVGSQSPRGPLAQAGTRAHPHTPPPRGPSLAWMSHKEGARNGPLGVLQRRGAGGRLWAPLDGWKRVAAVRSEPGRGRSERPVCPSSGSPPGLSGAAEQSSSPPPPPRSPTQFYSGQAEASSRPGGAGSACSAAGKGASHSPASGTNGSSPLSRERRQVLQKKNEGRGGPRAASVDGAALWPSFPGRRRAGEGPPPGGHPR